ncbi:uncharacterized protein LOC129219419, partial [Uloborus diversus]|uniref:uncharacterized protein LOC129219419 n=1 Tax=Uloborus diversus TaxID=327109 RepID=UPI002409C2FB
SVVAGLRLARLDVPAAVIRGEPAWLNCTYDLEKDELYSVKWYKNNVEFYRFLPSDRPPGQKYDLQGVYVDLVQSALGHVFLTRTDMNTEGVYRCEISAEAPSFQTVREEKEVRVYVIPRQSPIITAPLEFEIRYNPIRHQDKLLVSTVGLRFTAEPRHFWHGAMKLRCSAVISQAYSMSSEEIIVGDNAKASAVVGDGPVITGGKPKYQKGDTVDVNCTSAKSNPAAELKWFINDKSVRPEFLIRYPAVRFPDGQVTSVLGLRFSVRAHHFQRDEMRLKCTATLSKVINMSSEETLLGSSQQSSGLHISENTGAVINRGSTIGCLLQTLFVTSFLASLL